MRDEPLNRRRFLKTSAAGVAAFGLGGSLPHYARAAAGSVLGANDRISIALIGCGGRGNGLMDVVADAGDELNVEVGALCDVWSVNLERTGARLAERQSAQLRTTSRYREVLEMDDIDAVMIVTPDFSHGPMLVDAIRAGKDVYIEKPMVCRMIDANEALKLARESDVVIQVGTQFRSEPRHRAAAEILREGPLGHVMEVETAYHDNRPRWRRDFSDVREADVDWEQFLMYLPDEPFDPSRFREWQLYHDFTIGTIGILGAHRIDVAHWFMGDPIPETAVANGGVYVWKDGREHADTLDVVLSYSSGCIIGYSTRLGNSFPVPNVRMYGTRGTFDTTSWEIRGEGAGADALTQTITVPPAEGNMDEEHVHDWIRCMRSRDTPNAPIEVGYSHSVAGILGFKSLRTGRRHVYDAVRKEVLPA